MRPGATEEAVARVGAATYHNAGGSVKLGPAATAGPGDGACPYVEAIATFYVMSFGRPQERAGYGRRVWLAAAAALVVLVLGALLGPSEEQIDRWFKHTGREGELIRVAWRPSPGPAGVVLAFPEDIDALKLGIEPQGLRLRQEQITPKGAGDDTAIDPDDTASFVDAAQSDHGRTADPAGGDHRPESFALIDEGLARLRNDDRIDEEDAQHLSAAVARFRAWRATTAGTGTSVRRSAVE